MINSESKSDNIQPEAPQRNRIYRHALELYVHLYNTGHQCGLCYPLLLAEKELYNMFPDPYHFLEYYPEILKHKPLNQVSAYFWDRGDVQIRVNVLNQAILETDENTKRD